VQANTQLRANWPTIRSDWGPDLVNCSYLHHWQISGRLGQDHKALLQKLYTIRELRAGLLFGSLALQLRKRSDYSSADFSNYIYAWLSVDIICTFTRLSTLIHWGVSTMALCVAVGELKAECDISVSILPQPWHVCTFRDFFCNSILFAICTSTLSRLCKNMYTVACRRVPSSAPL
jgi:hypothetical protein